MRSITVLNTIGARTLKSVILGGCVLLLSGAMTRIAQASPEPQEHPAAAAADQNKQLADEIAMLRAQIAKLQAAQNGSNKKPMAKAGMPMATTKGPGMGMGMMDDKGETGAMPPSGMKDGEMGGMPPSATPAAAMGMCCMGEMGGMSGGNAPKPGGGMGGMSSPSSAMPISTPRISKAPY